MEVNLSYGSAYPESISNPASFWKQQAELIDWFRKPEEILSTDVDGLHRWYKGGNLNSSYLALDRHVIAGRGEQNAIIYDSPVTGVKEYITYNSLLDKVSSFASGLKELGVGKGDRVIIYLPMIPEAVIAMLACARIGAVHSVVFGGFAAHELAIRIDDAKPKVVVTANYGIEIDRFIEYKPIVDRAITESSFPPETVVILDRGAQVPFEMGDKDVSFRSVMKSQGRIVPEVMDSTDPLYILYTSGTTGKPKGVVRDNGGHAVALTWSMKNIYNVNAGDVYWAASDVGWVVGHSYIVYAPLFAGCTSILFEGKPIRTPDASTFWRVISEHKVNVMFTAPTAIRAIRKEDPKGKFFKRFDLSSLRAQFLAGERCDVSTLNWLESNLKVPVIDHWWQTESGWPMLANPIGMEQFPVKPGSATKPVCGYNIQILNAHGNPCAPGQEGYVAVKLPLPPGCLPTLYNDTDRFKESYLNRFPGYYFSGDGGYVDEDGYFFITGRVDDVINVAGHRLSTAEMEEVVAGHQAIAECAVIGVSCELKGQVPLTLVVRKDQDLEEDDLKSQIVQSIRDQIGAVASMKKVLVVQRLPKTRSGKILRKTLRAIADDQPYQIPSTIEDAGVLREIHEVFEEDAVA